MPINNKNVIKKIIVSLLVLIVVIPITASAEQHSCHLHGKAQASVIIKDNMININVNIPAKSILGYEGIAKTEKEKEDLNNAIKSLKKQSLFRFYKKRKWYQKKEEIQTLLTSNSIKVKEKNKSKETEHDTHHHNDHHEHSEHHDETHSEFIINNQYKIKDNSNLKSISTNLFKIAPRLDRVQLIVVNESKQIETYLDTESNYTKLK